MGKRALIVDDSKSARLSLARTLEKHAIEVDTAESAEQALEYLWTHRPDAIFMDHNMPGMDGLQAVRIIKNNPRTATIPIMMYTSQEGELYVGQARALGAIGVMPKQVKPADVTKVLYQLHLAVDRRSARNQQLPRGRGHRCRRPTHHEPTYAFDAGFNSGGLREQLNELRRTVLAGFDSQGDRLLADMRTVLQEPHPRTVPPARAAHPAWLPWALAAALAGRRSWCWWCCCGSRVPSCPPWRTSWRRSRRPRRREHCAGALDCRRWPPAPLRRRCGRR